MLPQDFYPYCMEIAEVVVCVCFYLISVSDSYIGFPFQKLVKMLHCIFYVAS